MPNYSLSPDAEKRILDEIDNAETHLMEGVSEPLAELIDGKKTRSEFHEIYRDVSVECAILMLQAMLREPAKIGIPLPLFEAIAMDRVKALAERAERKAAELGIGYRPGKVRDAVLAAMPEHIEPYRLENRFRFGAVSFGDGDTTESALATVTGPPPLPTLQEFVAELDKGNRKKAVQMWQEMRRSKEENPQQVRFYDEAGIDHSVYYKWKRGKLKDGSAPEKAIRKALLKEWKRLSA